MSIAVQRVAASLSLLSAILLVGGCAPQATEAPVPTAVPTEVPPTATSPASASSQFCSDYLAVSIGFLKSPITGDDTAMKSMSKDAITAEAQKLVDSVAALKASAPTELADPLTKVLTVLDEVVTTGDASKIQSSDLMSQGGAVDVWAVGHCGWPQVSVTATDYAFAGIPATIPAGVTGFLMTNQSTAEQHVLLIARRKPGSTTPTKDLMGMQGDVFASDLELVAATGAEPGGTAGAAADLTPGDYIAFCPIPQGGTPAPNSTPSGQAHSALGQYSEFTVK
jgi:hypothetical protein